MFDIFTNSLLHSIVTGFVSAYVTVKLALNRFYKEKHWEKKSEAYSSIMDSLHNIKVCADIFSKVDMEQRELSEERGLELSKKYLAAHEEFKRRLDVSVHFLSEDACKLLKDAKKEFDGNIYNPPHGPPLWDVYDGFSLTAEKTLDKLRFFAAADLHLSK